MKDYAYVQLGLSIIPVVRWILSVWLRFFMLDKTEVS
jgi:hypothetical protein